MGVNDLWPVLEPVKQHIHLQNLGGKTIAVDLSLWVCEAQSVKKMIGTVVKPHLRNLFFRISYLTQMDVKLVFVMEGKPPQLKAEVISKRNQMRYGTSGKTWSQKTGRSHFKSVLKECLAMLECLGIPWVQAAGEAEAMCAYLNAAGHVDGCLTNDGDAFLYGAHTVYRNFTMNTKDPHVDCYTMSSIKSKLGLDRDALVGLAILLGCDYLPKGIPGVGKEQALKLIQILGGQSLLQRFNQWNEKSYATSQPLASKKLAHCSVCSHPGSPKDHERNGCKFCKSDRYCEPHDYEYICPCEWHQSEYDRQLHGVENSIMKKACRCEGFPFHEVIQEFLVNKDKLVKVNQYQRPDLLMFQRFTLEKMEWPNHYACEKLFVLLTRYDMMERKLGRKNSNQLQPVRIVKSRIRNGVRCFEIEWEKPEHYAVEEKQPGELGLLTVEEESLFQTAYPEIVALYQKQKLEVKGKKQKSIKVKPKENNLPESDDIISFQSLLTLKPMCEVSPMQNSKLNLETSSHSLLPREPCSSLNSLLLPENPPCLNIQEDLLPSPRLFITEPIEDANKSLISESNQLNTSSCSVSVIPNLHLSTIDWEGTSFSNSPANQRAAFSHDLKPKLQSDLSAISHGFENIPEQMLCESEKTTANNHVLGGDLQKTSPEEHLLSGITNLYLQDLPLKERVKIKLSYPPSSAQPDVGLKTESLPKEKESHRTNNISACPLHLSKDLAGIQLQNESSEVLKGDWLFQEKCKMNTSLPFSVTNPLVKASGVLLGPPSTALDPSRKVNKQTTKKIVKSSVCLDKYSSDEESDPVFWKAKNTTQKVKHSTQKHNPHLKESGYNKSNNPEIHVKETELPFDSRKTVRNEENGFSEPAKSFQSFFKKDSDPETCSDSPLPLRQRLKLRFQNTLNEI